MSDFPSVEPSTIDPGLEALLIQACDTAMSETQREAIERDAHRFAGGTGQLERFAAVDQLLWRDAAQPELAVLRQRVLDTPEMAETPPSASWRARFHLLAMAAVALIAAIGVLRSSWAPAQLAVHQPAPTSSKRPTSLRPIAVALASGELKRAKTLLADPQLDSSDAAVDSLRRLCELLPTPTEHVRELVALGNKLAALKRTDGVAALGEALVRLWTPEVANAKRAAAGDALLAKQRYAEALAAYASLSARSAFRTARLQQIARCEVAAAGGLLAKAGGSLDEARLARAERLALRAKAALPASKRHLAEALLKRVAHLRRLSVVLDQARRAAVAGKLPEAIGLLEQVPADAGAISEFAQREKERYAIKLAMQRAMVHHRAARPTSALKCLEGLDHAPVRSLRDRIKRVVDLHRRAKAAGPLSTRDLWLQICRLESWDQRSRYVTDAMKALDADAPHAPGQGLEDLHRNALRAAAKYATKASVLGSSIAFKDRLDAAHLIGRALLLNPDEPLALRLRKDLVRASNLRFAIAQQKYRDDKQAAPFLKQVVPLYRIAAAAHPLGSEGVAKMAKAIAAAGRVVPDKDPFPDRLRD